MIDLLSLHVLDPRSCRLIGSRPFPPSVCSPAAEVAERMLWMLGVEYAKPDAMDLLRDQIDSRAELSRVEIVVANHGLAIEAAVDKSMLAGTEIHTIATADDAWQMMRLIAAHCDAPEPRFDFKPM